MWKKCCATKQVKHDDAARHRKGAIHMPDNHGKHTNTLTYLITIIPFPLQKWSRERALMLPHTTSSLLLKLHIALFNDAVSVTQICGNSIECFSDNDS